MKNIVLSKNIHLKVSLAWHYFAQSHKTSWKKSIFEKNKIMPQAGFEPTSSWLLEWSLSEFCHKDSCFPRVKNRICKNVQWSASFNFCHQVTTVLLHCDRYECESVLTGLVSTNAWLIPIDVSYWAKCGCGSVPGFLWKFSANCL